MSLVDKIEVRRGTATSIGVKIEEMLDGAERKSHETSGAKKAMQAHVKNLLGIVAAVDGEVEKSIPDLPTAKLIKDWLARCVVATENLASHLANIEMQALGEVIGYKATHDYIQKIVKEIDDSKVAMIQAIAEGKIVVEEDGTTQQVDAGPRLAGVRPPMSIAQQRKVEEAAQKAPVAAQEPSQDASEAVEPATAQKVPKTEEKPESATRFVMDRSKGKGKRRE